MKVYYNFVCECGHKDLINENSVRGSEEHGYYNFCQECGLKSREYTIITKESTKRTKTNFTPNADNCTVQIFPEFETNKCYAIAVGSNNKITNPKVYYDYIAKSVCYIDENGKVYKPLWIK